MSIGLLSLEFRKKTIPIVEFLEKMNQKTINFDEKINQETRSFK